MKNCELAQRYEGSAQSSFCCRPLRTADRPPQRIWDKWQQHLPGDEAWLIGEHRASGEKKYYLANLAAGMTSQLSRDNQDTMDLRAGPSTLEDHSVSTTSREGLATAFIVMR